MKVIATGFDKPDAFQAVPHEPRPPGRGEFTFQVWAAGVNPVDLKVYRDPPYKAGHGQKPPACPLDLKVEAAGVVTAVGADATAPARPILPGDEVIACGARPVRYGDRLKERLRALAPEGTYRLRSHCSPTQADGISGGEVRR